MIKELIEKYISNTYKRSLPSIEDPSFYKYLNKEVQFYRGMAKKSGGNFLIRKYHSTNKLEKTLR